MDNDLLRPLLASGGRFFLWLVVGDEEGLY